MNGLDTNPNAPAEENKESTAGTDTHTPPPPSVFGIIVVGLLVGLVVGLLTGPNFVLQGFFLGFAGGSLITAGLYFYTSEKGRPST
jgi:hypothetical protein